jgi:hypothetical protein
MELGGKWTSLVAAVASCLVLAACGGGDSSSSSSGGSSSASSGGGTLSKSELIEQGEKICKEGSDKIDDLGDTPSDPSQLQGYTDKLTNVINDTVSNMRELKPPPEVASDYNKLIDLMQKVGTDTVELTKAAKSADTTKLTQISKDLEKIATEGQDVAKRIGFKGACTG